MDDAGCNLDTVSVSALFCFSCTIDRQLLSPPLHKLLVFHKRLVSDSIDASPCLLAVSYTHLDVYKRQGLTFVGTMRKNKLEIPESYLPSIRREVYSTKFAFTNDKTLLSYVPKYSKAVVLISSMHHEEAILEDREDKLPEVIEFYNISKVGVDALDPEMCSVFCRASHSEVAYDGLVCCNEHSWGKC